MIGADRPVPLPDGVNATYVTELRPDHDRLVDAAQLVSLDIPEGLATAVVCLPRNRVQGLGRLAKTLEAVSPGGLVVVDGQKTDGIEPLLRQLKTLLPPEGTLPKAHGKIAWLRRPDTLPPEIAGWAEAAAPKRNPDGFVTAPGMFSAEGVDAGTRTLIDHLPAATGRAADLGAGWGALSAALLERSPELESLDLVEADHAALEAARLNVTDPRARFHWADVTRWGGGPYDLIVSNPPFHVSRAADPALGQAFIAAAARLLAPKGRLMLVANRQLPYESEFDRHFGAWTQVHSDSRFKILSATRPKGRRSAG